MRKSTTSILIGVVAIGALVAARSCLDKPAAVTKTPAKSAKVDVWSRAPSSSAKAPRPAPSGATSAVAAPAADGGRGDGRVVFFSPWGGSHKDQLGRERPEEGNPMGPMSLATGPGGKIYVLDEINNRIVRRNADGSLDGTSELKLTGAQDLAVGKDGSMAVLDRLVDKAIALYDPSGNIRGQLPLEGEGIDDTGHVTGIFVDGDDVYVEREHGSLLKIGDVNGIPTLPRTEVPGRPSRDGLSYLNAGLTDPQGGRAYVSSIDRATGEHRFTRELRYKAEISSIVLLDSDKSGTIYFGVELHEDPAADYIVLQCLEPQKGVPRGSVTIPVNTMPEETFRDFTVLDDGGVIYALRGNDGVSYQRYDCGG